MAKKFPKEKVEIVRKSIRRYGINIGYTPKVEDVYIKPSSYLEFDKPEDMAVDEFLDIARNIALDEFHVDVSFHYALLGLEYPLDE